MTSATNPRKRNGPRRESNMQPLYAIGLGTLAWHSNKRTVFEIPKSDKIYNFRVPG